MAILSNKRKLEAMNTENYEESSRSNPSRDTNVSCIQEDYTAQVSQEIEWRETEKLSQEFTRTESRFLGAQFGTPKFGCISDF